MDWNQSVKLLEHSLETFNKDFPLRHLLMFQN